MTHLRTLATLIAAASLAACTDYATFVTSTDIGISADVATQVLHIGYVRTELFTGPGYPESGAAPAAVGYLGSNLSAFNPKIKQLYATGDAAEIVTRGNQRIPSPDPTTTREELAGLRRPLVFGTGSNLGLQVGFAGGTPSKVKFGYNREELSLIPLRQQPPRPGYPDKYASVLASINMDQSLANLTDSAVKLTQFFATGAAAKNLAARTDIQEIIGSKASFSVAAAAQEEVATALRQRQTDYDSIVAYFANVSPAGFAAARDKLLADTRLATDPLDGPRLKRTTTKEEFLAYVMKEPGLVGRISQVTANKP